MVLLDLTNSLIIFFICIHAVVDIMLLFGCYVAGILSVLCFHLLFFTDYS
jgi:hypothetical protein